MKKYSIKILPKGTLVEASEFSTILQTVLNQGLDYPFGCQSGNCGACKTKLISGKVNMISFSEFALTQTELKSNIILACRATPLTNCVIVPATGEFESISTIKRNKMSIKLLSVENATPSVKILTFSLPIEKKFVFFPGQYANLKFSSLPYRSYSMANLPGEKNIEFHIKNIEGGRVSKYIANQLSVGEEVNIKGPEGNAYFLMDQHKGPILAIAGGTGIAPIKSIVTSALKNGFTKPIKLYFGVRNEKELYFVNYFENLKSYHKNLKFTPALSEPTKNTHIRKGLITDIVMEDIENFEDFTAYVAGQPEMVLSAQKILSNMGIPKSKIHADAFFTQYDDKKNKI